MILVVTPDHSVLSLANVQGVMALKEKRAGLNNALQQATVWCQKKDFDALLILPSDIPFIQTKDIKAIIDIGMDERTVVVISPDNERSGTNALLVKPPGILNYSFGLDSYHIHRKQVLAARHKLKVYFSKSIGFDIDYPEHYDILCKTKNRKETQNESKPSNPYSNHRDSVY